MDSYLLHRVAVRDVQMAAASKVENGVLHINEEELCALILQDRHIHSVTIELARPGESKRIVPIKDVIEPRAKISTDIDVFPGVESDPNYIAGTGETVVLDGVCVITSGPLVNFQEGLVDMSGPGADFCVFSKKCNVVLVMEAREGITKHEHEKAVRLAGIRAARYLGALGRAATPDKTDTYPVINPFAAGAQHPGLPKVLYVCQVIAQGLLHDNYLYGLNAQGCLPLLMRPTEFFDGAVISGNCAAPCHKHSTFHYQNNPIAEDLLAEHGKSINFVGVLAAPVRTAFVEKERIGRQIHKIAEMLGIEGAIVSEDGGGNPEADLMLLTRLFEKSGIKTVLVTDEYAGSDGASPGLADVTPEADAVVTNGNGNQRVVLPPMQQTIGVLATVERITGGHAGGLLPDGSVDMEIAGIMGSTNELGLENLKTVAI
ncbi:glycine/sarcosine/betaine reductase component B subunit [Desulfovibrio sp. OttesenSCG-928-G15]|nr:glycine/sarcosine/betaine reductase component B subunit [Desulfovibrio sp. OttesenSCG-928-G15]